MNELNKIICDTINNAYSNKEKRLDRDITYVCIVTEKNENDMYQLTYEDKNYHVKLSNLELDIYDKVHLIIPQGNFKNMYVLEDVALNYFSKRKN